MKEFKSILLAEYSSILNSYLEKHDENSLQRSYEFGRKAIESKTTLLFVLELFTQALVNVLKETSPKSAQTLLNSSELLAASLAPFEMTNRGYEDAIHNLQSLNDELSQKTSELSEANKEIESFSYSVSHDLRAPLRSIMGFSQILWEDIGYSADPAIRRSAEKIMIAAQKMDSLIVGLLNLSKLTRKELIRNEINLSALAEDTISELRNSYPEHKITTIISPNIRAKGDVQLLRVVLMNLLSNAWKFTSKQLQAEVEFGVLNQNGKDIYFVKDNGAGFDEQYSSRLFGAFQRFHSEKEYEGTGIGLATVQRIIHKHGGQIWANAKVGKGATFCFTLGSDNESS